MQKVNLRDRLVRDISDKLVKKGDVIIPSYRP
jgi:hypothetical protein